LHDAATSPIRGTVHMQVPEIVIDLQEFTMEQ
jgi:hypothetical protein